MASSTLFLTAIFSFILLSAFILTIDGVRDSDRFAESVLMNRKEKLSHLHFYVHHIISGPNATVVKIAGPENVTTSGFGTTMMMDDALTLGPEPNSKVIGRAQGIYAVAGQKEFGLLVVLNFVFLEGKYNGSTLSILGRNPVLHPVREMPIVGGSGLFRFARGYALLKTVWFNNLRDAIVEYNVSVLHY